ncbi:MAG: hypothetical protein IJS05_01920 [Paludibacteraceae bacterium]|nr:hypothetical protein [Paludibacteraceae bacterium]
MLKRSILIVFAMVCVLPVFAGWGTQSLSSYSGGSHKGTSAGIWCSTQQLERSYSATSASSVNSYGSSLTAATYNGETSSAATLASPMPSVRFGGRHAGGVSASSLSSGRYGSRMPRRSYQTMSAKATAGYTEVANMSLSVPLTTAGGVTSGKRVIANGSNYTGGMVAREFYNWLYGLGRDGSDAFLSGYVGDDYWYFDEGKLRELYELWIAQHPEFASLSWEEFLEQWFNTEQNQWFRMPVGDGVWVLLLMSALYAVVMRRKTLVNLISKKNIYNL